MVSIYNSRGLDELLGRWLLAPKPTTSQAFFGANFFCINVRTFIAGFHFFVS